MPLKQGKHSFRDNVKEFSKGKTFRRTARKSGKKRARSQAAAVAHKMRRAAY